jgi:hypothetical protein
MAVTATGGIMARQTIKDRDFRTIGYIEEISGNRQKAMDAKFNVLGYYERQRDVTTDALFSIVGRGNMLAVLIERSW